MNLSLGFLFCSIDLYFCLCASTTLSWWLWLCSRACLCFFDMLSRFVMAFPWWLRWQNVCPQCQKPRFDPWVGKIPWRREWLPSPVFLPGEFHGQRSLGGYSPLGHGVGHDWETNTLFFLDCCFWWLLSKVMNYPQYEYKSWINFMDLVKNVDFISQTMKCPSTHRDETGSSSGAT